MDNKTDIFQQNRSTLEGIAYRMLGTLADATDIVQDTYLKWNATDESTIKNHRAWLVTVCSRLALNYLKSAKLKRETYVGVWLPEPLIEEIGPDSCQQLEMDESVSVALLLALEKLTPTERAVYLLYETFDFSFDEIANILDKSNSSCRQLASRARKKIKENKPRFDTSKHEHLQLLDSFLQATRNGNVQQLINLLTSSVELYSDGGGKAQAVDEVLSGSVIVAEFFVKVWRQYHEDKVEVVSKVNWFNGSPGILIYEDSQLATAVTLDISNGNINRIYAIRNPDKLEAFSKQLAFL